MHDGPLARDVETRDGIRGQNVRRRPWMGVEKPDPQAGAVAGLIEHNRPSFVFGQRASFYPGDLQFQTNVPSQADSGATARCV